MKYLLPIKNSELRGFASKTMITHQVPGLVEHRDNAMESFHLISDPCNLNDSFDCL